MRLLARSACICRYPIAGCLPVLYAHSSAARFAWCCLTSRRESKQQRPSKPALKERTLLANDTMTVTSILLTTARPQPQPQTMAGCQPANNLKKRLPSTKSFMERHVQTVMRKGSSTAYLHKNRWKDKICIKWGMSGERYGKIGCGKPVNFYHNHNHS